MPRPGEDLTTADVVVPRLETLLVLAGTALRADSRRGVQESDVRLFDLARARQEGFVGDQASIVFTEPLPEDEITSYPGHRHPAAVHVERPNAVVFERNIFTHLGFVGLNLYMGTSDNRVVGNLFTDISASGISVGLDLEGNPSDPTRTPARDVIQNNYLSEDGVPTSIQTVGIMVGYTDSIVIEHNELTEDAVQRHHGRVGMGGSRTMRPGTTLIRYNEIHDVLKKMSDGGGIYTLSRQPGTFIARTTSTTSSGRGFRADSTSAASTWTRGAASSRFATTSFRAPAIAGSSRMRMAGAMSSPTTTARRLRRSPSLAWSQPMRIFDRARHHHQTPRHLYGRTGSRRERCRQGPRRRR